MKKLTEKEIENLLKNCLNEGFSINIFESCKYYRNGINNLLESLTDEDFDKLLTKVNLDLDEYILTNHIDALFGNNLRNNKEPENDVMEVNAFSTQLISALDKYVYMNFNKKIASIGKNATIEQLHSIIKQTLQEFINNEYNSNNVIIALSIFKRLSRKNKRKVIKHVYMYFTEQFLKSYPFFKPDL